MEIALKSCFGHPLLDVMNFLNEVVLRYPGAISFAPGRPAERHFDVAGSLAKAPAFVAWRAAAAGLERGGGVERPRPVQQDQRHPERPDRPPARGGRGDRGHAPRR